MDQVGNTPLFVAVDNCQLDVLQGSVVEATDIHSETPLMIAARDGRSVDIIRSLLHRGADVNATTAGGWTALMLASESGHVEISKILLDNGANVNARSSDANTALLLAAEYGRESVVKALLAKTATQLDVNGEGLSARELGERGNHLSTVHLLAQK